MPRSIASYSYCLILPAFVLFTGCVSSIKNVRILDESFSTAALSKPSNTMPTVPDSLELRYEFETHGAPSGIELVESPDLAFVSDQSGRVYCFSLETGEQLGNVKVTGSVQSAPLLVGNTIIAAYVTPKNETIVVRYDIEYGRELWERPIDGRVLAPLLLTRSGVFALNEEGVVYKILLDGTASAGTGLGAFCHSQIQESGDKIFIGDDKGNLHCLDTSLTAAAAVKISDSPISAEYAHDELIVCAAANGALFVYDTRTKSVIPAMTANGARKSVLGVNETVYFADATGTIGGYSLRKRTLLWQKQTAETFFTSPAVYKDMLMVFAESGNILLLDREIGEALKTFSGTPRPVTSPRQCAGKLICGFYPNKVIVYVPR